MNTLNVMFSAIMKDTILISKYQSSVYNLIKNLLKSLRATKNNPLQLLPEEKLILNFISRLHKTFTNIELYYSYIEFLFGLLKFSIDDINSDGTIRAIASIIGDLIIKCSIPESIVKDTLKKLFKKFEEMVELRFNNAVCKVMMENAKDVQPLWFEICEYFISISTFLIDPKATTDPEFNQLKWKCIMEFVKNVLVIRETSLYYLERPLMEQVVKKSQEFDIKLITFIYKVLLRNSKGVSDNILKELVALIDCGCTAINISRFNFSSYGNPENTLAKLSLDTLLDLCNSKANCEPDFKALKEKISNITTLTLVNRCKEMFHSYKADEKRSGRVPLPR